MNPKTKTHRLAAWQGAVLALVAPGLVLASAACNRTKAQDEAPTDAAAVNAADPDAETEVAPPPPVVAGDPNVPVNEGVVGTPPLAPDYFAETAPPPPLEEEQPQKPDPVDIWVPGYWWWSVPLHKYVWVGGAWRNPPPPPNVSWTAGAWLEVSPGRYSWRPGIWGPAGIVPPPPLEVAPPVARVEVWGTPPGVGYVWGPGYYAWRGGIYEWVPGSWIRPPYEGVTWIGPCYVYAGGRYYFQPGRWDHPPASRGVVYRPDPEVRPGMRYRPVPLPREVVIAHAGYVSSATHAVATGAQRQPNGGFTVRGGAGMWHPGNAQVGGPPGNEHGGPQVNNLPHGNPPPGFEHPGNEPHGGPQVSNLPHGNPPPGFEHPGNEPHGGPQVSNLPHGNPAPGFEHEPRVNPNNLPHGNAPPGAAPPGNAQHGGPPPGGGGGGGGGSGGGHGGGGGGGGGHGGGAHPQ